MIEEFHEHPGPRIVVITGPVGAGKSTVAMAIDDELRRRDSSFAMVDMDFLRQSHPHPADDRFNARMGFRNLAAIWPNFREAGARLLIVADVIEHPSGADRYREAIPGAAVTVVRLNVPMDLVLARLAVRERDESLEWSQRRAPELQGIMERADVGDVVIEVGERDPRAVAAEIVERCGLR